MLPLTVGCASAAGVLAWVAIAAVVTPIAVSVVSSSALSRFPCALSLWARMYVCASLGGG